MTGIIFHFQRFSIHDGPGIRTNIFLKGCPLRCEWCHNPEGLSALPDLTFLDSRCVGCRACVGACPENVHTFEASSHLLHRNQCSGCGKCAQACAYGALEQTGRSYTAEEAVKIAVRDRLFWGEEGGVTLTGGEPMLQAAFSTELAAMLWNRGISVCMETCGYAQMEAYAGILPYIDRFLFDIKETDEERHKAFTGVGRKKICDNLSFLNESGARIVLRCPIIPDRNLRMEHFEKIAETANSLENVLEIDIEPYHPLGISKARNIGVLSAYPRRTPLEKEELTLFIEKMRQLTNVPIVL